MQPEHGAPIDRATLLEASKDHLVELLLVSLSTQAQCTANMQEMQRLLAEALNRVKTLEDQLASQEAELIVLRNRP